MDELQLVVEKDGVAMTDSRAIAKVFGKEHSKVMRCIREKQYLFNESNITESSYINEQNKEQPMYLLDMVATKMIFDLYRNSPEKQKALELFAPYFDRDIEFIVQRKELSFFRFS